VAHGIHVRMGAIEDASAANGDAIANIGFVVGHDSVAVIDPGGSREDGESLRLALRTVTRLPVSHVVMTHVHPDHIFGAEAFAADNPVFVGAGALPEQIAARGAFYRKGLERILGSGRVGEPVMPTHTVQDAEEIDLGRRRLRLVAHPPAHTVCDLSVLDLRTDTLLAGDLLFVERVPSLAGDLKGWLAELARLRQAGAARAVPGHGPVAVQLDDAIPQMQHYLGVLLDQTRAAIAHGVPLEQAVTEVARSERGRWRLFDDYNGRNVAEAYRQLEWE
jgi:quinoprotein relay system zinc metallohydrolase 2